MASTTRISSETVGLDYSEDHVLHAASLRFAVKDMEDTEESRRLIAAVDAALARRAADVEDLEINFVYGSPLNFFIDLSDVGWYLFRHGHAADITPEHVAAWLRFAAARVTGRFTLAVPAPPPVVIGGTRAAVDPAVRKLSAELPASARAQAMSLNMGGAALAVPAAAAFGALTDLALSHARVEPGGADERNLGELLSASSCPRLRRLRLERVAGLATLRLRAAATLEELRLERLRELTALELDAPGLRALHGDQCFRLMDGGSTARVSAPALETLAWAEVCPPEGLQLDAPSVRRLDKIFLYSHTPDDEDWNAGAVGLLQQCTAVDSLRVIIAPFQTIGFGIEDIKERMSCVPVLGNLTNLTIHVDGGRWHKLKATISGLVAKCSRVQCLSIDIKSANDSCSTPGCLCKLEDDPTISLEHLREAKITGFGSSSYHRSLVQLMIAGAPALEKMTVEFIKAPLSQRQQNDDSEDLGFNMPCKGQWSPGHGDVTIYEWTADSKREKARQDLGDPTLSRL
ncbi:unnamed protein product [Urochloa humidicola]